MEKSTISAARTAMMSLWEEGRAQRKQREKQGLQKRKEHLKVEGCRKRGKKSIP